MLEGYVLFFQHIHIYFVISVNSVMYILGFMDYHFIRPYPAQKNIWFQLFFIFYFFFCTRQKRLIPNLRKDTFSRP